jgi:hypothetical protein
VRRDSHSSFLVPAIALLLAASFPAATHAAIATRHVVIVAIDGARFSETLGDPTLAHHQRIGNDLRAIGAMPGSCWNLGVTTTVPGMTAMWSGRWQALADDGTERPHLPTLAEYLRASTGDPDSEAIVVAGKTKLYVLGHSDHPLYGAAYGGVEDVSFPSDLTTYEEARARLLSRRPKLMIINLGDTDVRGHQDDWLGYLAAIQNADSLVWQLWTAIQADPGLANRTTLFVTNDHGRHDDFHGGFQNHGDACGGCRLIELVMAGPDTKAGYASTVPYDQRDIARTAGYLLGIPMPLAEGRVMDDLLIVPSATASVAGPGEAHGGLALSALPNPTRGPVWFALSGAGASRSRVEILDAGGRRVRALPLAGGAAAPRCVWDGHDELGRASPPGIYFARATSASGTASVRFVRVR